MRPGRITILSRGAMGQCPCCRSTDLFASRFRLRSRCPGCGLPMIITYRFSKTLWLGIYYMVLPHELSTPKNDKKRGA